MKRHQVDPVSKTIVGLEFRGEPIGERAEREVVGRCR